MNTAARSHQMNPIGIIQATLALFEGAAQATNPKRQNETKREQRQFLIFYAIFILTGIGVVCWVIWSLYFNK